MKANSTEQTSEDHRTLVVLDDSMHIVAHYRLSSYEALLAFITLLNFIGFDRYYLTPRRIERQ